MLLELLLDEMAQQLFADRKTRERICRHYGVEHAVETPDSLVQSVVELFDQQECADPLNQTVNDSEVFRAAVLSLASNSRYWYRVLGALPTVAGILRDFDPSKTAAAVEAGKLSERDLALTLGGITGGSDARAIVDWASFLSTRPGFYARLATHAGRLDQQATDAGQPLGRGRLPLLLVSVLVGDSTRRSPTIIRDANAHILGDRVKVPGMGHALGAEFLRNLGWAAFKPDRHIQRVFDRWCPEFLRLMEPEARQLAEVVGSESKTVRRFFQYGLAGVEATPAQTPINHADNVTWLLASYVEKKGSESDTVYMR